MPWLTVLLAILVVAVVLILPLKLAAAAMGARRTGALWCLLALLGANILQALGLTVPVIGSLVAFLLSALAFAAILDTSFMRGIGIAVLHLVFSVAVTLMIAGMLGIGLTALTAGRF